MDSPRTAITWSANQQYLDDFAVYYRTAQKLFLISRKDTKLVVDLFDHVHQIYVMEEPYLDNVEHEKLLKMHDDIRKKVEWFASQNQAMQNRNFGSIYYLLDIFFRELNRIAVAKRFFPMAQRERSLDDKMNAMRQK